MVRNDLSLLLAPLVLLFSCANATASESARYSCQILQPLLQKSDDPPGQLCLDAGPDTGRLLHRGDEYCVKPKEGSCVSPNGRVVTLLVDGGGEMSDALAMCDLSSLACKVWVGYRNGEFLSLVANDAGNKFALVLLKSLRRGIVDTSILAVPVDAEIPLQAPSSIPLIETTYAYSEGERLCGDLARVSGRQDGAKPLKSGNDVSFLGVDAKGGVDVVRVRYAYENCLSHGRFERTRSFVLRGNRVAEFSPSSEKQKSRRMVHK